MSKGTRYNITLPREVDEEATEFVERSGISMNDLCRQGVARLLMELRQTGKIEFIPLPRLETKPAAT